MIKDVPNTKSKIGRPTIHVFPAGTYNAQFMRIAYFANDTQARLVFYVLNDEEEITENIATLKAFTVKNRDKKAFEAFLAEEFGQSVESMRNQWFKVEVIVNNRGLNSVTEWDRVPDDECMTVPQWCREYLSAHQQLDCDYSQRRETQDRKFRNANSIRKITQAIVRDSYISDYLKILGIDSREQLIQHLESQFRDGMNWENWGKVWQIDHIRPLAKFDLTKSTQILEAANYRNLQPLFTEENLTKYNQ